MLDAVLTPLCNRPLFRLDPIILAALRVGAAQLLILDTPPHAAVSATVEALDGHYAKGLVNAVLRKLVREGGHLPKNTSLSTLWSHPADLVDRWLNLFGKEKTIGLLEWNNTVPTIGGINTGNGTLPGPDAGGKFLSDYIYLQRTGKNPILNRDEKLYIQDEAAALVGKLAAELLGGKSVLEIGAAPGGKTVHLDGNCTVDISVDMSFSRMQMWKENALRLSWKNSFPVVADCTDLPFRKEFELVFIDAPCTGTGVYRRRFDARWGWSTALLAQCVEIQNSLLDSAVAATAQGGVLLYSTCSIEPEENEIQVKRFEEKHPEFERIPLTRYSELVNNDMICIFPHEHGIDGLFATAWRKVK